MVLTAFHSIFNAMAITISPSYAERTAKLFWKTSKQTHTEMRQSDFEFYFDNIIKIIQPLKEEVILDYGCGSGEISYLFSKAGYTIWATDISELLLMEARRKNINCLDISNLYSNKISFDKIFINNAFFYIHPGKRKQVLTGFYSILSNKGKLYILDEPDFEKRKKLNINFFKLLFTYFFPVYQPEKAGFFTKPDELMSTCKKAGFVKFTKLDSWSIYRSHFIIEK